MSQKDGATDGDKATIGRRQYLKYTSLGTVAATGLLAGCSNGGDGDTEAGGDGGEDGGDGSGSDGGEQTQGEEGGDEHEEELPEGVSEEEFTSGPVPSVYETAMSMGREERKPEELVPKADVSFTEYDEATENSAHQPGTACGNCSEYIPDRNGDGFGACAKVEGYVGIEDWCTLFESLPEPEVPEGMSEEDLATATVPDVYQGVKTQGAEVRKDESELLSHEEVQLTEAVDAAKDGLASPPGASCGNCAEFIPDKDGDGWGACRKVKGYIAVEDWCSLYEHVSEVGGVRPELVGGEGGGEDHEELPEGVSEEEFANGPVPSVYQTATSLGNENRNPDEVNTKADVSFSEFDEAQENSAYQAGSCCANCADYIPDKNGDTFGACAEVGGYIDGADWCTVYEALPEPEVPDGMSEDELATAEVPEEYQSADSQGGEARKAAGELLSHSDVSLTESVEAIADGAAQPGQSCGNCAEFIPDKNGDTWGACAKVEGYIAVEDWCTVYEHISEVL